MPVEYEWEVVPADAKGDIAGFAEYAATAPPEEKDEAERLYRLWLKKNDAKRAVADESIADGDPTATQGN